MANGSGLRSLVWLGLAALLLNQGCALPTNPEAPGGLPAGPTAPGATPGLPIPGQGAPPPDLTGTGQSPNATPGVVLPAPAELNGRITQLQQKYQFKSLKGEATTAQKLDSLDANYAKYPAGSFKDLDIVFANATGEAGGPAGDGTGVWFKVDANGQDASPQGPTQTGQPLPAVNPAGARITYFGQNLVNWVFIHEIGHHVTLWVKPAFGQTLIDGLGYQMQGQRPANPIDAVDGNYVATNVQATTYPTEYSKSGAQEHIAEVITTHMLGRNTPDAARDPIQPSFQLPANLAQTLRAELPGGAGL